MAFNSVPSPIGGWNARDPLDAMPPTDAVELVNLFPNIASVDGRGGSLTRLTIAANQPVQSLMPFTYATGSALLAACNGNIWNINTSAWTAASLGSGFTSDKWQSGHFNNHLVMVNGADIPQVYDGTTFGPINATLTGTPQSVAAALTAGTLVGGTYAYRVTAVINSTESLPSAEVTIAVAGFIQPPSNTAFTQASGTLATATYYYRVTATNSQGETDASSETSLAIAPIVTPIGLAVTSLGGSGQLNSAITYSYQVSAVNAAGETLACAAVNFNPPVNFDTAHLSWTAVTGATGYHVYGRQAGLRKITRSGPITATTFNDDGSTTPNGLPPSSNTTSGGVNVNWTAITGATGYNIYGRTTGAELKLANVPSGATTTWTDNGSLTPSGALPVANTTGQGVTVTWTAISGATGYNVYGRTTGAELKLTPTPVTTVTFTDTGTVTPSGALPVVDTTTKIMIGTVNFKGRALYWTTGVCGFWYAIAGAFQGSLSYFPLDLVFHKGSSLSLIITWSRDNGDGVDDLCAFISTNGECLVYQGTDPGNALNWSLVGRFSIGRPLGVRAHGKLASAEILLTTDGFMSMDEAISNQRAQELQTFGGKIVLAAIAAASAYGANFGWESTHYPRGQMYVINVPLTATQYEQYVRNTSTGAWCRFTGWNACTFCVYQDRLYFGTPDGRLVLADTNLIDTLWGYGDDGVEVLRTATQAYAHFNEPGMKAQLTGVQIVSNVIYPSKMAINVFQDYQSRQVARPNAPNETQYGIWDVSNWDETYWAGLENRSARPILYSTVSHGFALALNLQYNFKGQQFSWWSTNYLFKPASGV